MAIKAGDNASATEVNKVILKSSIIGIGIGKKQIDAFSTSTFRSAISNIMVHIDDDYLVEGFSNQENSVDYTNTTCPVDRKNNIVSGSGTFSNTLIRCAFNARNYDDFEDGSIDANKWTTTGTVNESGGTLNLSASSTVYTAGANGFDAKALGVDSEVVIVLNTAVTNSSNSGQIQVYDGSSNLVILNRTGTSSSNSWSDVVRIAFDFSAGSVYIKTGNGSWSLIGGAGAISAFTNWYIRFQTTANAGQNISAFGYIENGGTPGTVDVQTNAQNFKNTKSAATPTFVYSDSDSDVQMNVSADNGSNFNTATKNEWTTITNTGTQGVLKATMTLPTTVVTDGSTENIHFLSLMGSYFDG